MKLTKLTLMNFQCFGAEKTVIELDKCTTFIGENGAGKSAALLALCRMFGASQPLRELRTDDFHLLAGDTLDTAEERELFCEVRIDFPELEGEGGSLAAIPPAFRAMLIAAPGQAPFCRIRLIAKWTRTPLEAGEITSRMVWVYSTEVDPPAEALQNLSPLDRARIQVFYVPGSRDASRQLANASGTLLNQLLKAVKWTDGVKADIREKAEQVRQTFLQLAPVTLINSTNATHWQNLYDESPFATPSLAFMGSDFNEILRDTRIVFNPTHGQANQPIERLSDGQQSLFYFAFINTLFSIRRQVYADHHTPPIPEPSPDDDQMSEEELVAEQLPPPPRITDHISYENLRPAPLTVFAIEEPENHLAPHYLGRIMRQLSQMSEQEGAQVVVTSHCPSIVARIEPEHIRHFALQHPNPIARVTRLTLPVGDGDAFKYVKQAVQAYPELYFSRLVILGEGDSEEYLLKRFAQLSGAPLDIAFVSVVPLGGRFVNHLWRLLTDLQIPYITILDLDRERHFGGWRTIRYVIRELLTVLPNDRQDALLSIHENGQDRQLTPQELETMADQEIHIGAITAWCQRLEQFDIFLSSPLDIDFLMLSAYTDRYKAVYEGQPKGFGTDAWQARVDASIKSVLGSEGGDGTSFTDDEKALFPWYSYIFLGKGKPTTHSLAWLNEETVDLGSLPTPLNRLFGRLSSLIAPTVVAEGE